MGLNGGPFRATLPLAIEGSTVMLTVVYASMI